MHKEGFDWIIPGFLDAEEGALTIDGVSAPSLAAQFGTPLFVFSESRLRSNLERLKAASDSIDCTLKICYAAKANSSMGILKAVLDAGSDLEVNSGGELYKALKIGFRPEQVIFNGTSKSLHELEEAISAGIYAIQSDSLYELELTERVAKRIGKKARVSLRIVPEIETETLAGLKTAMASSKFGMTFSDALESFMRWPQGDKYIEISGIHLHVGSQTPDPSPYQKALAFLIEKMAEIHKATGHKLSHLNLGGGFPVNYLRDRSSAENMNAENRHLFSSGFSPSEAIAPAWEEAKRAASSLGISHLLDGLKLLIEPGRSVIGDAGICLASVMNKKERAAESGGKETWLLTDAGFNILLSMETYKWYYHLISAERASFPHRAKYKLAGPLCDGGDVYFDIEEMGRLPDHRLLPEDVAPGELLALLNCGAYSIAQMFQYNARQLPAVVLIKQGGSAELIRRRDTYEDLLANDIW